MSRRNLQGLLKFCMSATKSEDAPAASEDAEPLSEEDREFLKNVLESTTVDVVQQLVLGIKIISDKEIVSNPEAGDLSTVLELSLIHI